MLNALKSLFFYSSSSLQRFLLVLLGVIFFIPFIGKVHLFDWDEINFAEITREMLVTGDFFRSKINFESFYEKPPLFNWIQIFSFSIFGNNEFAARFPNALFGIFSLLLIYNIGKSVHNKVFGMLWALLYMGSLLPHFYFKTGVIDPVFNFFIFGSVYLLQRGYETDRTLLFVLAGLVNGLAIITKGPVGLLIVGLTVMGFGLFYARKWSWQRIWQLCLFVLSAFLVTWVWILPQYLSEGETFIIRFFDYMIELLTKDVATHGQPFYYHFLVLFFGCFPLSVYAFPSLLKFGRCKGFHRWMLLLFWVVLLLFSAVTTKIVHYSSMCYFPLAYLAAKHLIKLKENHSRTHKLSTGLFLILGMLFSGIFIAVPLLFIDRSLLLSLASKDIFAQKIVQGLEISPWISLWGLLFFAGVWGSLYLYKRRKILKLVIFQSIVFSIFLNGELAMLLPPIESAVQGSAIGFYKRFAGKDVYLSTVGFKSYGVFYYSDIKTPSHYSSEELLEQKLDKPAYFISRIDSNQSLLNREDVHLVERKGGFELYVKNPK